MSTVKRLPNVSRFTPPFRRQNPSGLVGHHCLSAGEAGAAAGGPRVYDEALNTLAEFCRTSDSDAARVSAANALLDRGYGKLLQQIEAGAPGDFNFASMSEEELDAMIAENMASLGYTKTN